jgi:hypothetical protein
MNLKMASLDDFGSRKVALENLIMFCNVFIGIIYHFENY